MSLALIIVLEECVEAVAERAEKTANEVNGGGRCGHGRRRIDWPPPRRRSRRPGNVTDSVSFLRPCPRRAQRCRAPLLLLLRHCRSGGRFRRLGSFYGRVRGRRARQLSALLPPSSIIETMPLRRVICSPALPGPALARAAARVRQAHSRTSLSCALSSPGASPSTRRRPSARLGQGEKDASSARVASASAPAGTRKPPTREANSRRAGRGRPTPRWRSRRQAIDKDAAAVGTSS